MCETRGQEGWDKLSDNRWALGDMRDISLAVLRRQIRSGESLCRGVGVRGWDYKWGLGRVRNILGWRFWVASEIRWEFIAVGRGQEGWEYRWGLGGIRDIRYNGVLRGASEIRREFMPPSKPQSNISHPSLPPSIISPPPEPISMQWKPPRFWPDNIPV